MVLLVTRDHQEALQKMIELFYAKVAKLQKNRQDAVCDASEILISEPVATGQLHYQL